MPGRVPPHPHREDYKSARRSQVPSNRFVTASICLSTAFPTTSDRLDLDLETSHRPPPPFKPTNRLNVGTGQPLSCLEFSNRRCRTSPIVFPRRPALYVPSSRRPEWCTLG